jgi:hypothetical protein
MPTKPELEQLYLKEKLSASRIAKKFNCSANKINYWLAKYVIQKRTISEAIYQAWNPSGDPFHVREPQNVQEGILYGLGVGLYWGEGNKAHKTSVRLGNSSPTLVRKFIEFLVTFYGIDKKKLRFGLQVFGDMDARTSVRYWMRYLSVSEKQFYPKIIITPHRGVGNYREKTKFGVITVYFNNRKLRDIICAAIDTVSMHKPT